MKLISENININFIGKMKQALICSSIIIVIGLVSFMSRGESNFGIDFIGGLMQQVKFTQVTSAKDVRGVLKKVGLENVSLQEVYGAKDILILRSAIEDKARLKKALESVHGADGVAIQREEMVGPAVGKDLRRQGLLALLFSLIAILLYVSWRFEFKYAIGAIVALFHDVLITVGILSFFQVEISLQILAALLTIVGYSLNDTIVVFDRIRECLKLNKKGAYEKVINISINQTLSRTLLTSVTTFLVVLMLFLFGGEVIHNFAFALMIGILVGTYSSIFIASSTLFFWNKAREGKK